MRKFDANRVTRAINGANYPRLIEDFLRRVGEREDPSRTELYDLMLESIVLELLKAAHPDALTQEELTRGAEFVAVDALAVVVMAAGKTEEEGNDGTD